MGYIFDRSFTAHLGKFDRELLRVSLRLGGKLFTALLSALWLLFPAGEVPPALPSWAQSVFRCV